MAVPVLARPLMSPEPLSNHEAAPLDVRVIVHTHWDREWYLPAGRFRQRLVNLVDALLDGGATPDAPVLLDGQVVVLDDYLDVRPDRAPELADALRGSAIEAGPWYVLADELIPSGEALLRNLLEGRRRLAELDAEPPPVLYCPDSFGHPAALPELATGFGLPLAVVWRGYGGASFPYGDSARWRSASGAAVLLHHLPEAGYEHGSNIPADEELATQWWREKRTALAPRSTIGVVPLMNGADHHAPQHDLADALESLSSVASPQRIRRCTLASFARAAVSAAADVALPVVMGELRDSYGYTWTLQGTLAARAGQKRRNAAVERLLLRDAEPWEALARLGGSRSAEHHLRSAWRTLLLCHPHDTLCGCSTDEVARAMDARLEDALAQATGVREDALLQLLRHDRIAARTRRPEWKPALILRNAAPRERGGVAEITVSRFRMDVPVGPGSASAITAVPAGEALEFELGSPVRAWQVLSRETVHERTESPEHYPDDDLVELSHCVAWVDPVPGLSLATARVTDAGSSRVQAAYGAALALSSVGAIPVWASSVAIESPAIRVCVEGGELVLEDRRSGIRLSSLVAIEDVGDAGDLYTHSPVGGVLRTARVSEHAIVHGGPLRAELRARLSLDVPARSDRDGRGEDTMAHEVDVFVTLDAGSDLVRIRAIANNRASDHRLRLVIATGIRGGDVYADSAFGPVQRRPIDVSPHAQAMETPPKSAPLARYVTVTDHTRGATVYSDGLAEYEALSSAAVAVTLVRSVGELSRPDLPERPGHAGWPTPTPEAQCFGPLEGRFALLLHESRDGAGGDAVIDQIERTADDVLLPLSGNTLRSALDVPAEAGGAELTGRGLAFSALKTSADGQWTVLRCVNVLDHPVHGAWRLAGGFSEVRRSRLDETPGESMAAHGFAVEFVAAPREVVTILVR